MSDIDQSELLSQFSAVTGTADDRAKFYLESANWNLQLALSSFYEGEQDIGIEEDDELETGAASLPLFQSASSDDKNVKPKKEKKPKSKYNAAGAQIVTLHNMSSSESEDEDERGQAFYAGGSERSGQQVLGPPRKNPSKDFVSEIFKSAQESGAEIVENPSASRSTSSRYFGGSGYRLGQTDDDHVLLADPSRPNRPQNIDPVVLRLWRQGFTINDSELRLYEEKKNKEFLECITKGQLPPELRQQGNMVQVNMEDHRHEDFKPSAAKIKPFAGKGHTLGSPTPNIGEGATSIASASQPSSAADNEINEKLANEQLKLDIAQPATSIQIRLADGSRLSSRFNLTHTVADLRNFISTARPQYASQPFLLLTTFPSKELADGEQTIEKAGLLNAAVMQRLK